MTTMTAEEKLQILETYGECTITDSARPFSETGNLYEYEIRLLGNGNSFYRTGETYNNAIDRMYQYVQKQMKYGLKFPGISHM